MSAHLNTIPHHVDGAPDEREPEHNSLRQKVVEILVEEQQQGTQEPPVQVMHLALGHVGHDQAIRHLCSDHAKGQDVVRGVCGKDRFRGLLGDNERRYHDQAEGDDRRDDARSLWRQNTKISFGCTRFVGEM